MLDTAFSIEEHCLLISSGIFQGSSLYVMWYAHTAFYFVGQMYLWNSKEVVESQSCLDKL